MLSFFGPLLPLVFVGMLTALWGMLTAWRLVKRLLGWTEFPFDDEVEWSSADQLLFLAGEHSDERRGRWSDAGIVESRGVGAMWGGASVWNGIGAETEAITPSKKRCSATRRTVRTCGRRRDSPAQHSTDLANKLRLRHGHLRTGRKILHLPHLLRKFVVAGDQCHLESLALRVLELFADGDGVGIDLRVQSGGTQHAADSRVFGKPLGVELHTNTGAGVASAAIKPADSIAANRRSNPRLAPTPGKR